MRQLIIDPGYSAFKWAEVRDGQLVEVGREPTVISEIPDWLPNVDFGVAGSGQDGIEWKGKRYLVGPPGMGGLRIPVTEETLFDLAIPLYLKRFKARPEDRVILLLSLSDWDKKEEVVRVLQEKLGLKVKVLPQGVGIWVEAGMPAEAVVFDVGFNTLDVIPFREGEPSKEAAFAVHGLGLVSFLVRLRKDDPRAICEKLESGDRALSELIQKHYWDWVVLQVRARPEWQAIKDIRKVVIGGGGANFVPKKAGQRVKDPETANVRGIARLVINKTGEIQEEVKEVA